MDSVFNKLQLKLDSKFKAIATKTSTALDLFHQKLKAHKASTITANNHLGSRMSQIKNSTKQIVNNMTSKLEAFALQQGETLESLATEQHKYFTSFSAVIATLNQTQATTEQQGINDRFESMMHILHIIKLAQQ